MSWTNVLYVVLATLFAFRLPSLLREGAQVGRGWYELACTEDTEARDEPLPR